jgi:hypothetical protein
MLLLVAYIYNFQGNFGDLSKRFFLIKTVIIADQRKNLNHVFFGKPWLLESGMLLSRQASTFH